MMMDFNNMNVPRFSIDDENFPGVDCSYKDSNDFKNY